MTTQNSSYVYFGAQLGDTYADYICEPHFKVLRTGLDKYCSEPYTKELDEFYIIIRVDGDFSQFAFEGCKYLRLMRKKRYITVDIGVPESRWDGVEPIELRKYLIKCFKEALVLMVNKLNREKISVNSEKLFQDFAKLEEECMKL